MSVSLATVDGLVWRKSSRSSGDGNCVEVAFAAESVVVRDSKDRYGPTLRFGPDAWRAFVTSIQDGAFDLANT